MIIKKIVTDLKEIVYSTIGRLSFKSFKHNERKQFDVYPGL